MSTTNKTPRQAVCPPCKSACIYPVRYALCGKDSKNEALTQKMLNYFWQHSGLKPDSFENYSITLRSLRQRGLLYILPATDPTPEGLIENDLTREYGKIKINYSEDKKGSPFYIALSEIKWSEAVINLVCQNPAKYMQKFSLQGQEDFVQELYTDDEKLSPNLTDMVEEYRAAPGHLMSIRGYEKCREVCDSERDYLSPNLDYDSQPNKRMFRRRWENAGTRYKRAKEVIKNSLASPHLLVALHDPIGMAREFADLHNYSCETISSHAEWHAYGKTIADIYASQEAEKNYLTSKYRQREWAEAGYPDIASIDIENSQAEIAKWEKIIKNDPQNYRIKFVHNIQFENISLRSNTEMYKTAWRLEKKKAEGYEKLAVLKSAQATPSLAQLLASNKREYYSYIYYHNTSQQFIIMSEVGFEENKLQISHPTEQYINDYDNVIVILSDALAQLKQDCFTWLKSTGQFGFCNAFELFDTESSKFIREQLEEIYAACHKSLSINAESADKNSRGCPR